MYSREKIFESDGELDYYEQNKSNADYHNLTNVCEDENLISTFVENYNKNLEKAQQALEDDRLFINLSKNNTIPKENCTTNPPFEATFGCA